MTLMYGLTFAMPNKTNLNRRKEAISAALPAVWQPPRSIFHFIPAGRVNSYGESER